MSTLSEHVSLTITQDNVGIARAGFGTALILSHNATFTERVRYYGALLDVADDFATTSPEYRAASALFAQSPHPEQIAIGRAALQPTQKYVISIATVRNSYQYAINVAGEGVTTTAVSAVATDGSATNDEAVALIVTALNLVVGKNYTAVATGSSSSQVVTVTANAAGDWFSLEVVNPADLGIKQTHVDPGVATDLDAILLEQPDWYCLLTNYNSTAYVEAAAAWVESQSKIYLFDVNETDAITVAVGSGTDTMAALHTSAYTRTAGAYHPSPVSMMSAAWAGRVLPLDPGSETWKFKTLAGVPAVTLSSTHRVNIRARKANTIQTVAGRNITWEGTTFDGNFIDVKRGLDWLEDDMTKGVFGALAGANKIPYTNAGVALVVNEIEASLDRAVKNGILAPDPVPLVTAPKVADVSTSDRSLRLLPDIKFSATLAGAIHKVVIAGTVSV